MPSTGWTPRTPEDRLLALYLSDNPGMLFLEVEVWRGCRVLRPEAA